MLHANTSAHDYLCFCVRNVDILEFRNKHLSCCVLRFNLFFFPLAKKITPFNRTPAYLEEYDFIIVISINLVIWKQAKLRRNHSFKFPVHCKQHRSCSFVLIIGTGHTYHLNLNKGGAIYKIICYHNRKIVKLKIILYNTITLSYACNDSWFLSQNK